MLINVIHVGKMIVVNKIIYFKIFLRRDIGNKTRIFMISHGLENNSELENAAFLRKHFLVKLLCLF
jgi:hypothetical protein